MRVLDKFQVSHLHNMAATIKLVDSPASLTGIGHYNQCDESLFRSIKRIIRTKATVEHFWERSVPELLQHESLHFAHDSVYRGAQDQRTRVQTGHIHRDILEKAMMYLNHADKNILMVCIPVSISYCKYINVL